MFADSLLYAMDLMGCSAAALAGAFLAKRVGFDVIGGIFIAALGAIGGGTCRDLLINRHPIFWLHDLNYLYVISLSALFAHVFYHYIDAVFERPLRFFDAFGLGAFAVIGFQAALAKDLPFPIVVLMGTLTGVLGGIMRDVVCGIRPLVLQREIYISCVILGGLVFLLLENLAITLWLRNITTMSVVIILRLCALYWDWQLPNLSIKKFR